MKVSIGGVLKDVVSIKVCIGGSWKSVTNTKFAVGGAWKGGETYTGGGGGGGFALSIYPASYTSGTGINPITTDTVTATPSGGVGPFTYSWMKLAGTGSAVTPTSASTAFTANLAPSSSATGEFRCTCTDALGSVQTADVEVEFFHSGG